MEIVNKIKGIFDAFKIPYSVWFPIMMMESGGNPLAHNPNGEDSRGLFQINIKANPRFAGFNLFDPVINSQIAAEYFILPALNRAKQQGLTNPVDITEFVYHYGIRPYWTEQKKLNIRALTEKALSQQQPAPAPVHGQGIYHIVKAGESLSSIAALRYNNSNWWPHIYNANKDIIGPNPDIIHIGDKLFLPDPTAADTRLTYTIQPGDNLQIVAHKLKYANPNDLVWQNPGLKFDVPGTVIHYGLPK